MLSSFDNVVAVYIGMSQNMHTSVAKTTNSANPLSNMLTSIFTADKNWSQEIK
jgi:hypothetical protein